MVNITDTCDVTLDVDVKLRNDVQPFLYPISFLIKSIFSLFTNILTLDFFFLSATFDMC